MCSSTAMKSSTKKDGHDGIYFAKTGQNLDADSVMGNQEFLVFSLSTVEFAPRARRTTNPGLRVYRAFPSVEGARAYIKLFESQLPGYSMFICKVGDWNLAMQRVSSMDTMEVRVESLLSSHIAVVRAEDQVMQARLAALQSGKTADDVCTATAPSETETTAQKEENCDCRPDDETEESQENIYASADLMPESLRDPDQRIAIVSFVLGKGTEPEFAFCVHGLVATEHVADVVIRDTISRTVRDFDIQTRKTGEWWFPQHERLLRIHHRHSEYDELMKGITDRQKGKKY